MALGTACVFNVFFTVGRGARQGVVALVKFYVHYTHLNSPAISQGRVDVSNYMKLVIIVWRICESTNGVLWGRQNARHV